MNPTTTILSLVAAALAGVTIVTFNDADLAKQEVIKAKEESLVAIRASGAKVAAAERKTFEAEVRAKAALAGAAKKVESVPKKSGWTFWRPRA